MTAQPNVRHAEMIRRYRDGETLQQIGDVYGITRQRIQQILAKHGITARNGGRLLRATCRAFDKHMANKSRVEQKISKRYGCDLQTLIEINGSEKREFGSPAWAFYWQKTNAGRRGIEWKLSLPEWWKIWKESGHWEQRGRGIGRYVMARIADVGPYESGNVHIRSFVENIHDYYDLYGEEHKLARQGDRSKVEARRA